MVAMDDLLRPIQVYPTKLAASQAAAVVAADLIRGAINSRGEARVVGATGESQLEFLAGLLAMPEIAWDRVELFHLDEYVGLPITHPASFRRYLLERLIRPAGIRTFHLLDGETDALQTCREVGERLRSSPIDVIFAGIGENGHIAFNDPPADFETDEPYLVVQLDEACRRQQVGEGWFQTLAQVPERAITLAPRQFLQAKAVITVVPDTRKAAAVQRCLEGPISPAAPASILRAHPGNRFFLDEQAASLLSPEFRRQRTVSA
jgi:glucosamine-6-phosphate deaminase